MEELLLFNYQPQARNKLIARAFKEIGKIEKYGSGIKRIFTICNNYEIKPPKINIKPNSFEVILYKEKIDGGLNGGLNDVINVIRDNPGANTKKISEIINIPIRTVERWISELKKMNKIVYKGSKKTGGYFIK